MSRRIDWGAVALTLALVVPTYCLLVALVFVVWLAR